MAKIDLFFVKIISSIVSYSYCRRNSRSTALSIIMINFVHFHMTKLVIWLLPDFGENDFA